MIFSSAVELPASRRSSKVFIHSSAAPGVSPLPGVARLPGGAADPRTNGIQQTKQHQQRYYQHCGMAGVRGFGEKTENSCQTLGVPLKSLGLSTGAPALCTAEFQLRRSQHSRLRCGICSSSLRLLEIPPVGLTESLCAD